MRLAVLILLLASSAAPAQTGSISGVVRDAASGQPLDGVRIYAGGESARTDAQGRFRFGSMDPGSRWISAYDERRAGQAGLYASVKPEEETAIEIRLKLGGSISGRVVNEDGDPVAGAAVLLLERRYELGLLVYAPRRTVVSEKSGDYHIDGVFAERDYLLLAKMPLRAADEGRGQHVLLPTLYPAAQDIAGAQAVTLLSGENRPGVDIRMLTAPSFCIEGEAERIDGVEKFSVLVSEVLPFEAGWKVTPLAVKPDAERRFRVCGIHPGEYQVSASGADSDNAPYGAAQVLIGDRDLANVRVPLRQRVTIAGDARFDPPPRDAPRAIRIGLATYFHGGTGFADSTEQPANYGLSGGMVVGDRIKVPGPFTAGRIPSASDYELEVRDLPEGCYTKEATFGETDILQRRLRLSGDAAGSRLTLVIGCDGGVFSARVLDKSGNPVSHVIVYLMPESARSEAELAAVLRRAEVTNGWSGAVRALPPGKYLALATEMETDGTAGPIEKLWHARSRGKEIEIGPGAVVQATLEPVQID